jgi:hypothetical protein
MASLHLPRKITVNIEYGSVCKNLGSCCISRNSPALRLKQWRARTVVPVALRECDRFLFGGGVIRPLPRRGKDADRQARVVAASP